MAKAQFAYPVRAFLFENCVCIINNPTHEIYQLNSGFKFLKKMSPKEEVSFILVLCIFNHISSLILFVNFIIKF